MYVGVRGDSGEYGCALGRGAHLAGPLQQSDRQSADREDRRENGQDGEDPLHRHA